MADALLTDIKAFLKITGSGQDTNLGTAVDHARGLLDAYLNRTIATATYTEYYDGDGSDRVVLNHRPVTSVTSLHDDPDRGYGSTYLIAATDYILYADQGIIVLDDDTFAKGKQNIKCVFAAGWTKGSEPEEIQNVLIEMSGKIFEDSKQGDGDFNLVSKAGDGGSTVLVKEFPMMKRVGRYREIRFA